MKKLSLLLASVGILTATSLYAKPENYAIDVQGAHAFVQFKVSHLGYSYIYGQFNEFDGSFTTDSENIKNSSVSLTINTASVDTNHAERDKHIRSGDFLNVKAFPEASFTSTAVKNVNGNTATLVGDLTLGGVTKSIEIAIAKVGEGKDPWGGYRSGFEGTTKIKAQDFNLGPKWLGDIEFDLVLEGVRQ